MSFQQAIDAVETALLTLPLGPAQQDATFEDRLQAVFHAYDITGCTLVIMGDGGELVGSKSYGARISPIPKQLDQDKVPSLLSAEYAAVPITSKSLYQMASISKAMTAFVVMRLVDQGVLDLDEPITNVGDFELGYAAEGMPKVTLRDLLCHEGGTSVRGYNGYNRQEVLSGQTEIPETTMEVLLGMKESGQLVKVIQTPGVAHSYSGGGFTLIQHILETVTNVPFSTLLRTFLFDPLNMPLTSFTYPLPTTDVVLGQETAKDPIPGGCHLHPELAAAGAWSNAEEMANLAKGFWKCLNGDEGALLKKGTAWSMLQRQGVSEDMGLGWFLQETEDGGKWFKHDGANWGYSLHLRCHTSSGQGYGLFLTTASFYEIRPLKTAIFNALTSFYKWPKVTEPFTPPPFKTEASKTIEPAEAVGDYVFIEPLPEHLAHKGRFQVGLGKREGSVEVWFPRMEVPVEFARNEEGQLFESVAPFEMWKVRFEQRVEEESGECKMVMTLTTGTDDFCYVKV
ncbi:hypothetical protein HDU97_008161 [Phlyctochytrium planicorne]|nr:hypothetical protein HDU97_008161 [Phlyctochytrium planicorne]